MFFVTHCKIYLSVFKVVFLLSYLFPIKIERSHVTDFIQVLILNYQRYQHKIAYFVRNYLLLRNVSVISSDPPGEDGISQLTSVPLKTLSD